MLDVQRLTYAVYRELAERQDVISESAGEGAERRVVILPQRVTS